MSFVAHLINGISLGSVYALIALGYTMVYGIAKMLNFAHGDVIMIGGYVVFVTASGMGINPLAAIIISMAACTVLGVTIERVAYRPLRGASPLAVLITAIGVSYLLQNVALLVFGSDTKAFSNVVTLPNLELFGGQLIIKSVTIVTVIVSIIIMVGLTFFRKKDEDRARHDGSLGGSGSRTAYGHQCERHDCGDICHRLHAGFGGRRASVFRVSVLNSLYRFHAGYQGVRCGGVWRDRVDSRRFYRRNSAGRYRESEQSLYFFPAFGCDRVQYSDHCAAGEADGTSGQEDSGEGLDCFRCKRAVMVSVGSEGTGGPSAVVSGGSERTGESVCDGKRRQICGNRKNVYERQRMSEAGQRKGMEMEMKVNKSKLSKTTKNDMITYGMVILTYIVVQLLVSTGHVSSLIQGLLVPFCTYVIVAVALNLTVGILGELSLGHAGFMWVLLPARFFRWLSRKRCRAGYGFSWRC